MSIILMTSQSWAQMTRHVRSNQTDLNFNNEAPAVPAWPYRVFSDSCNFKTYKDDDNMCDNGFSPGPDSLVRLGNYFMVDSTTSGIIESVDMCFSSARGSTAQSCIVYFYKADRTTIFGQSPSFINTGATWPDTTWVYVPCPDIPYIGPFYAMVDYSVDSLPRKNYFCCSCDPWDSGYADCNGVWSLADDFFPTDCMITFLQRINVCEYGPDGIKERAIGSILIYPNPAYDIVNIVSSENINEIEMLNFLGQSIYKTDNINRMSKKVTLGDFSAGQYFVKVVTRGGTEIKKIAVIH
jgi:hypothetical protein